MFLEVNELKGLIVSLGSSKEMYREWRDLKLSIPCIFIVDDQREYQVLTEVFSDSQKVVKREVSFIFGGNIKAIYQAIQFLSLNPFEVAYVTANPDELEYAICEPIGTILINKSEISYEYLKYTPDFITRSVSDINHILSNENKGYFAEVSSTFLGRNALSNSGTIITTKICAREKSLPVIALGRYYPRNHHKHEIHQFSRRLIKAKDDISQNQLFIRMILPVINYIKKDVEIHGLTRVPPRPDGRRDRLLPIVNQVCKHASINDMSSYIKCVAVYPPHKNLNREERFENVRGMFEASQLVKGRNIILLDDILTTGATASECALSLLDKGAASVTVVVLAINQLPPVWDKERQPLPCPNSSCNGYMRLTFRKDGLGAFFGCSNYWNNNCKQAMNFLDGWHAKNRLNVIQPVTIDDDIIQF